MAIVRWMGWSPGNGFGNATESYLDGLRTAGIDVIWTPIGWSSKMPGLGIGPWSDIGNGTSRHSDIARARNDYDIAVVHSTPVDPDRVCPSAGKRPRVAYTTWETDRLPAEYCEILNRYDAVLVPSRFSAEVFGTSGLTAPIHVIPHIAGPFDKSGRCSQRDGPFTFYAIATWTTRKALRDTVEAFVEAFDHADDVRLLVHTTAEDLIEGVRCAPGPPPGTRASLAAVLAARRGLPEIILSTERLSAAEIDTLHSSGDCYVSLSRGEGFGLGPFEAGARGTPAILTGWGGWLDYLPDDYPYCVSYDLVPTATDPPDVWWSPRPDENWARARIDHAAALMREVFERRDEAAGWGHALRTKIQTEFGSESVTRELVAALEGVAAR